MIPFFSSFDFPLISGATLCKGLNRGLGTVLAGSLAFFIEYVADFPGQIFRAVFIGVAVFMLGKHLLLCHARNFPQHKYNLKGFWRINKIETL